MSGNDESSSIGFGYSSKLINWILDSGATCHMTPQVSDFIPSLLKNMDNYIEIADGHYVPDKQKGQNQITMYDHNGDTFISTLHKVLFAPDLCNRIF